VKLDMESWKTKKKVKNKDKIDIIEIGSIERELCKIGWKENLWQNSPKNTTNPPIDKKYRKLKKTILHRAERISKEVVKKNKKSLFTCNSW
jgi:hypothetical protein